MLLQVNFTMASHKDAQLYGVARPKKDLKSSISSSSSLSFASNLSSLLSKPAATPTADNAARGRPSKPRKDDIFSSHHRATKKRSAADISTDESPKDATTQVHQRNVGAVDVATLHRSRRKMEEKARLYAAMKRGDYVPPAGRQRGAGGLGEERGALVDFDRKWAERQDTAGGASSADETSSDDGGGESEGEMVEYTDEFGRARQGRRRSVERRQRQARAAEAASRELDASSARPARPDAGLIYGDSIQSAAFDPDAAMAERMAAVAARRDRSMTPPDETHYDATKEVRSKGVGFYAFSGDKEAREKEMEALDKERAETEKRAQEREERRAKREAELKNRRRILEEKRGKLEADRWLKGLEGEIAAGAAGSPNVASETPGETTTSTLNIEREDSAE